MKKRVLLTLCGIAALAAAIVCLPVSREINTTAAATEYRLDDPAYAVEHTVTIQGRDARNLLGYGHFEGMFAVSGFESGQPGWMIYTVFSNKKSLRTTYSSNPSGEPCTRDLFCLWANRDWSDFAGLIMEVTDHADHPIPAGFWSAVPPTGTLPWQGRRSCFKRTRIGTVSFNRRSPDSLIKTINRPDAKRPACCYVPGFNYFWSTFPRRWPTPASAPGGRRRGSPHQ